MFKKKTILFLTGLLLILVGCIGGNESDTGYGVKLERNNGNLSVVSDQKSLATEFKINKKISENQIESNKINIISTGNEETIITVLDSEAGESLVKINGLEKGVIVTKLRSITQEEFDKEMDFSNKALKRSTTDPILLGDFNSDNIVDLTDLSMFADIYNKTYNETYDIFPATLGTGDWESIYAYSDGDGEVNIFDFIIFGRNFNKETPYQAPILESVTITGPTEVDEEATIILTGTANYDDGSTSTDGIVWSSANDSIATVNNGTVTGIAEGSVNITASKDNKTATHSVTVKPINTFDGEILYVKADSAPTIWCWEVDGISITEEMGYTWDTQPSLEIASDEGSGWYKFEIPSEYLTGGKEISVMINSSDIAPRTSGLTGWYSDGVWYDENPDGPSKPTVGISLNSGTYVGSTDITITTNGENITERIVDFEGQNIVMDTDSITITLSDYLLDKESGTLTVSATNGEGTTTESKTYTRDDEQVVTEAEFTWDNALMYFVITDRFYNGDTSNDNSYGRKKDGLPSVGTFHGGDIVGLTQKLDYLDNLGVNSIWVTAPYEQIHGYVSGGDSGDFPHYAYHGYYPLDYTMMDKNMGTVEEFRTFVDEAHQRGIRIVMDIVMNHAGYNTLVDAAEYGFGEVSMDPSTAKDFVLDDATDGTFYNFHSEFNYSGDWSGWWGANWVRAGKDDIYQNALGNLGSDTNDDINGNLANLPDFKTNEQGDVGMAPILSTKWSMEGSGYDDWIVPAAKDLRNNIGLSPAVYIEEWLAAWVEEFGVDGFRVDTAKHVEKVRWGELKGKAQEALVTWRNNNPSAPGADWDEDFWMTGEHYDWTIGGGDKSYFGDNNGDGIQDFDSMINFGFSQDPSQWGSYASDLNTSNINALHYISSHDTQLGAIGNKISAGTSLILAPGGSQIFYGDETDRPLGPTGSDSDQGTRSHMNWGENADVLSHWQKLGQFRRNNPAVGAGTQTDLGNSTYGRIWNSNKVVIKVNASGSESVNVSGIFADGTSVRNAYNGETGTVSSGSVTFTGENGVILIEEVK